MINLGFTRRWANRPVGAVERCAAALKRRRSNGVAGSNYIRHIPRALYGTELGDRTLCGREARRVNCVAAMREIDAEDVCLRCKKARMR